MISIGMCPALAQFGKIGQKKTAHKRAVESNSKEGIGGDVSTIVQ
jgi:hypothetical protein